MRFLSRLQQPSCCECQGTLGLVQWASCPQVGYICRPCAWAWDYPEYMVSLRGA